MRTKLRYTFKKKARPQHLGGPHLAETRSSARDNNEAHRQQTCGNGPLQRMMQDSAKKTESAGGKITPQSQMAAAGWSRNSCRRASQAKPSRSAITAKRKTTDGTRAAARRIVPRKQTG